MRNHKRWERGTLPCGVIFSIKFVSYFIDMT